MKVENIKAYCLGKWTADEIEIRSIRLEEYPLLKDFLYDAIYQVLRFRQGRL